MNRFSTFCFVLLSHISIAQDMVRCRVDRNLELDMPYNPYFSEEAGQKLIEAPEFGVIYQVIKSPTGGFEAPNEVKLKEFYTGTVNGMLDFMHVRLIKEELVHNSGLIQKRFSYELAIAGELQHHECLVSLLKDTMYTIRVAQPIQYVSTPDTITDAFFSSISWSNDINADSQFGNKTALKEGGSIFRFLTGMLIIGGIIILIVRSIARRQKIRASEPL